MLGSPHLHFHASAILYFHASARQPPARHMLGESTCIRVYTHACEARRVGAIDIEEGARDVDLTMKEHSMDHSEGHG